jgi:ribonuclease P protein component
VVYVAPARGPQQLSDAVAKTAPTWQAGLVVSKAVGNSVVRHRVARRLRAVLAALLPRLGEPKMVVVRALPAAAKATYSELERSVGKCLRQAAC